MPLVLLMFHTSLQNKGKKKVHKKKPSQAIVLYSNTPVYLKNF